MERRGAMEVKYERCGGIDVHKKSLVACVIVPGTEGQVLKAKRSFGTRSEDLLELSTGRKEYEVTTIAIESTGVYWKGGATGGETSLRFGWSIRSISRS